MTTQNILISLRRHLRSIPSYPLYPSTSDDATHGPLTLTLLLDVVII